MGLTSLPHIQHLSPLSFRCRALSGYSRTPRLSQDNAEMGETGLRELLASKRWGGHWTGFQAQSWRVFFVGKLLITFLDLPLTSH